MVSGSMNTVSEIIKSTQFTGTCDESSVEESSEGASEGDSIKYAEILS